ncbi:MAG: type VI secretion system-associated protein TagK [Snodgrassella sp.]|uniref:type VI secretion system-associated protein TagK n=1 Tax=Snodgrassella sp. TaxID=2815304 RepID=UPI002589F029|nr:type VI secretion system-associated protein TagK [Snodgrassella sp.]MCO6514387.1 type VI secretion system-associated protein TagK [Snodgrassella sp.]MCO6520980.1 type VI secretion system-associated protein TagK [Snodgrassella sp.]
MNSTLLLRLDYCRGIKVSKIYELNDFAFFSKTAIYNIHIGTPPTEGLALCIQPSAQGWQLLNQSEDVLCRVNGVALALNHWCHLHDGDILEWGLSIWQVNPREQAASEYSSETTRNFKAFEEITPEEITPLELTWFDPNMQPVQQAENPFDLVMSSLLYEMLERTEPKTAASLMEESPANAIFQELLQEYRQALDTPQLSGNDYVWQKRLLQNDISNSASPISLADLSGNTDPLMTLQDIVSGPLHIDDIFNGLDSLREAELFQTEEPPEILHLFAPGWQQQNNHTHMPPMLTRKEHHAVSVDSHYRMSQSPNSHQKDSADDNPKSQ